ncbi:MAG: NAD-dependent protein deacetylase [Halieaceae bacterium]|jgi:NAD-dependent SIR2 family protein deacetylase|nr:NAD-dependent protein deacetylase [Halieaceae bacterium]
MNSLHTCVSLLRDFVAANPRLVVITGAGVSVSSGIPAYRDCDGVWRHSAPITHQEFVADAARRRRYWARSLLGWPAVRDARPNAAHLALARLEQLGRVDLLITQNVDRLHQRAGSTAVIDLHGRVDQVRCLHCVGVFSRELIQQKLLRDNPQPPGLPAPRRPDGDADVADEWVESIAVPRCDLCGGTLIPDVVFFGGTVPRERVQACRDAVAAADAVLAVGSSLQVFSGFRFCRLASQLGKPIAVINPGKTRADALADLKLQADCGPLLEALASVVSSSPPLPSAAGNPS